MNTQPTPHLLFWQNLDIEHRGEIPRGGAETTLTELFWSTAFEVTAEH